MASNVVVIDTSLRRATVKTTPSTYLNDVFAEACDKLGLNSEQYDIRYNEKAVDLSRNIHQSGLPSGAKLNLVQASRSPSIVSVAVQLPVDYTRPPTRLTDKFPSNTSIWQILRKFESGAAGGEATKNEEFNFTQRAQPLMSGSNDSGAGRLCYEIPVLYIMGREIGGNFIDLQKTLRQLGFNNGSVLIRLSYKTTDQPLEEAMSQISEYFSSMETPLVNPQTGGARPNGEMNGTTDAKTNGQSIASQNVAQEKTTPPQTNGTAPEQNVDRMEVDKPNGTSQTAASPASESSATDTSSVQIFAPPSATTPAAVTAANFNEKDYVPTIAHAQAHQSRLNSESRNKKLLSSDEIAAQEETRQKSLSQIKEVVIRFRLPDQSQAQKSFDQNGTASNMYELCREIMHRPDGEAFIIRGPNAKGTSEIIMGDKRKLIKDMGWTGRVLVTVAWGDDVLGERRRQPALKEEFRNKAEVLNVGQVNGDYDGDDEMTNGTETQAANAKSGEGKKDIESKMKGFLKGLSKK